MPTGVGPVVHGWYETVLHRVLMNVVYVISVVFVVAYGVLPIARLPGVMAERLVEALFDQLPTKGIVCVSIGEHPNRMQMIGQHAHGVDLDGVALKR